MDINAPVFPESIADGEVATLACGRWAVGRSGPNSGRYRDGQSGLGGGGAIRGPSSPKS